MRNTNLKASPEILDILKSSELKDNGIQLNGQLSREDYVAVNKFLTVAGCKWNKGKGMHIFIDAAAKDKMIGLINTGEVQDDKKLFQSYYTPDSLAAEVVDIAGIKFGDKVLEPSAGHGAIADRAKELKAKVHCVEIDPVSADILERKGYVVKRADFLALPSPTCPMHQYEIVVMNPPFTGDQDIKHVIKAFEFLAIGGKLVAIMGKGWTFGNRKACVQFREFLQKHGGAIVREIPEGTFKESGTNIATVIIEIIKRS